MTTRRRLAVTTAVALAASTLAGCVLPARVLVIGDSIHSQPDSWVARITCTTAVVRAVPGRAVATRTLGSSWIDAVGEAYDGLADPPTTVIVAAGLNDITSGITAGRVATVMDMMEARLRGRGATTIRFATITPLSPEAGATLEALGYTWWRAARAEWNRLALARGGVDAGGALGDTLDPVEDSGDGVHPGSEGHRLIAAAVNGDWCPA